MRESPPLPFPHGTSHHPPFPLPSFDPQPPFPQPIFPRRSRESTNNSSHRDLSTETASDSSSGIRFGVWSGVVAALIFYVFASATLIFGVYAPQDMRLGSYSSILINPNHLFVQSIKVEGLEPDKDLMLYGFHKNPPLDAVIKWTDSHKVTFPASTHKEWIFYLNEGSRINISYSVNSPRSSSLVLVIVEGNEGLDEWLDSPSYPNTALSWNIIYGNGSFQYEMQKSSSYYIAVGNLNYEVVEVELKIGIKGLLYNTTEAYHRCNIVEGLCKVNLFFLSDNAALLTSPGQILGLDNDDWSVKIVYGPRWSVYLFGIGVVTLIVLLINHILNIFRSTQDNGIGPSGLGGSERTPLLIQKDENPSSQGSSFASDSEDEANLENVQAGDTENGKPVRDDEYNSNIRRLCAICFDDPRDCFFIPCGHCVACFGCATRIVASSGNCPICRRHTKKVRKIYTV